MTNREQKENIPLLPDQRHLSRLRVALGAVTVEPALLLYTVAGGPGAVLEEQLWLEKTCLFNLHYSKEVCDGLLSGQYPTEQSAVQRQVSLYYFYMKLITHLPAVVVVLLLGICSDNHSRRLPLFLPLLAYTASSVGVIANCWWWTLPPEYLLLCSVPVGLTGGHIAISMANYAYVGASSRDQMRTTRFSLLILVETVGNMVGRSLALLLFQHGGYITIFTAQACFTAAAATYCLVFLQDRLEGQETPPPQPTAIPNPSILAFLKRAVQVMGRQSRSSGQRLVAAHTAVLWLRLFSTGSLNFNVLYTRKKFGWNYKDFTRWSLIDIPFYLVGIILVVPLLSYRCGAADALVGFVGSISLIFSYVIIATAPVSWVLYIASVLLSCEVLIGISSRAALSKLVSKDELGAVFSMLSAGKMVIPIISLYFFRAVYNSTLDVFPGAVFALTAVGGAIIACIYVWMLTSPGVRPDQVKGEDLTV